MRDAALAYLNDGMNCAQCLIKAADDEYGLRLGERCYGLCSMLSNGFGVGLFCGVPLAGLMLLGLTLSPETAKRARLLLLSGFFERFGSFDCAVLTRCGGCDAIITETSDLIKTLIDDGSRRDENGRN